MTASIRTRGGASARLAVDRWSAPATDAERALLATLHGPVLDLGCGPGRLVTALAEIGVAALGVDASPVAVEQTLAKGGSALCRSLFSPLPGEGRWRTVLLIDGNIGIGGDPVQLLRRVAQLVAVDGVALVEVGAPGDANAIDDVRLETDDETGPWFPWAWVSADDLARVAGAAGLVLSGWQRLRGRWIGMLEHP